MLLSILCCFSFFFKQKTAYEMRISDWSSDVCSSDLKKDERDSEKRESRLWSQAAAQSVVAACREQPGSVTEESKPSTQMSPALYDLTSLQRDANGRFGFSAKTTLALAQTLYERHKARSEEHTSELQSLMRISYAVFSLKK